jgi:hypothetical protein
MRIAVALVFCSLVAFPALADDKTTSGSTCGHYGTSVDFYSSPSVAATQAKKEQKLVFVLHVSGLFEDPKFT